jgi:hypothetical protein
MKTKVSVLLFVVLLSPALSFAEMRDANGTVLHPIDKIAKDVKSELDIPCLKNTVSSREDVVKTAFTVFTVDMTKAMDARKAGLLAAFDKTTAKERSEARKIVRATFRATSTSIHKTLQMARQNAWDTFKTASKVCKGGVSEIKDETPSVAKNLTEAL